MSQHTKPTMRGKGSAQLPLDDVFGHTELNYSHPEAHTADPPAREDLGTACRRVDGDDGTR